MRHLQRRKPSLGNDIKEVIVLKRMRYNAIIMGFAILNTPAALGIVQVNDAITAPEGLTGNVRFTINGQSGNKDEQEYGFDNLLRYKAEDSLIVFIGDYSYSETNSVRDEDELFAHLRWVELNQFGANTDSELFVQYQYDDFADLSRRELIGGNVRYRFEQQSEYDDTQVILGVGAFYELEVSEATDLEDSLIRANIYTRFVYDNKGTYPYSLYASAYFQPALEDISDLRALIVGGVKFPILERVAVAFEIEITHNETPFIDIEKTDIDYGITLSYEF